MKPFKLINSYKNKISTVNNFCIKNKLTTFEMNLLSMDSRIRLFTMFGEIDESDDSGGFIITSDFICIASGLPLMSHEISHMVEINENRLLLPDFGMKMFNMKTVKPCPLFSAFIRETRVIAIERHISHSDKNRLNNPVWIDMAEKRLPFGRFKTKKDIEEYTIALDEKTYKSWSKDRIEAIWIKNLAIIQNSMEQSKAA